MGEGRPRVASGGRAARIGRRVGALVFWVGAVYLAIVGFYSIIPQVFFPKSSYEQPAGATCEDGVTALRGELLARAGQRVSGGGVAEDETSLRRWLDDWDDRYAAVGDGCEGSAGEAWAALGRLRHRTEITLRRFDEEQAPLVREIDRRLRADYQSSSR